MNESNAGSPAENPFLVGPAVPSSSRPAPADTVLEQPLGPFIGARREPAPAAPAQDSLVRDSGAAPEAAYEDLPWLLPEQDSAPALSEPNDFSLVNEVGWGAAGELPEYMGGVPEVNLDDDILPMAALAPQAEEREVVEPAPQPAASRAEPAPQLAAATPAAPVVTGAAPSAPGVSPLLEEIAGRLERIARSLRDRSPAELLGGGADPLETLIAGYALGLAEGARRGEDAPGGD